MMRLKQWIPVLVVVATTSLVACGEEDKPASTEESEENSDAAGGDEAKEGDEAKADEAKADEAKADEAKADEAKVEGGEAAKPPAGAAVEPKVEASKPAPMSPEQEAAVTERCGAAFDNTVAIMQKGSGKMPPAPPQIITQMREQRDKTLAACLAQAKVDPSGARMLDCMIAARTPADIRTCTRKFGDVKPLKPPVPLEGHGH